MANIVLYTLLENKYEIKMTSSEKYTEYEKEYREIKSLIKRLLEIVKYYGKEDWRVLSMLDRGEAARKTYKEITGKQVWED